MAPEGRSLGTIGFIGLGDMGASIAANYARNGLELVAYDLRTELEAEVTSWGGKWAQNGIDVIQRADILCLCLFDDNQVRRFVDESKLWDEMHEGALLVLHSTLSPGLVRDLAAEAASRRIFVVDAPVSGSHAARQAGELTVMVDTADEIFERLRPMWNAVSSHAFLVGTTPGAAQVVKLCNNMMGLTNNLVALEAVKIAQSFGIDEKVFLEVARTSSGNSWMVENWGTSDQLLLHHANGGRDSGFSILLKDIKSAVEVGSGVGERPEIAGVAATTGANVLDSRLRYLEEKHSGAN